MDYSTLLSKAKRQITNNRSVQNALASFQKKSKAGTLAYKDALKLANALANAGAYELKAVIPPETELKEFADEFVGPLYKTLQKTTLKASKQVQDSLLQRNKLNLTAASVREDVSRIEHLTQRIKEASKYDEVSFLLGNDVTQNILKSSVHDTIRENADHMNKAGFKTKITRSDGAGCCEWCESMTGTYDIDDLPPEFWGVHKGCTCTFDYQAQDRFSRIRFETTEKGMKKVTEDY